MLDDITTKTSRSVGGKHGLPSKGLTWECACVGLSKFLDESFRENEELEMLEAVWMFIGWLCVSSSFDFLS